MNINENEHLSTSVRTSVHGVTTEASNDDHQTGIPGLSHLMTKIDNHLLTSSIGVPVNSTRVSELSHNKNASVPSFISSTEIVPDNPSSFVDSSNATSFGMNGNMKNGANSLALPRPLNLEYPEAEAAKMKLELDCKG
ncbi:hypothetical protein RJ641_027399 [Dillenia turbinata]|uniref:Uncharacterized protein n=1 Tax=Dillenia turbinata TaxID=194707 RepID=A0AAN8W5K0_9MAGN